MNTRQHSKFLAGLVTSLILFSMFNHPALATAGGTTRASVASDGAQGNNEPGEPSISTTLSSSPVMFIENIGQFGDGARFQVRGGNGTIWLAEDALWVTLLEEPSSSDSPFSSAEEGGFSISTPTGREPADEGNPRKGVNLKLSFVGSNPAPQLVPFDSLETSVNYFIGDDPAKSRVDVPVWGGVRYTDLYPSIDLEISSENGCLVQRLVAREGADLNAVVLRVEGADSLTLDGDTLRLGTSVGEYTLPLLQLSGITEKPSSPAIAGNEVTSPFGNPQAEGANVAPQSGASDLLYATFLGGESYDLGYGIAVDSSGAAYVTGFTWSSHFPTTTGAFDTSFNGGGDAFVVKLNPTGSGLLYATFLGGSDSDFGKGIVVDASGAAYVTGYTSSSGFPTTSGAYDRSYNGGGDAFAVKLKPAGNGLLYATFFGGGGEDNHPDIAVDGSGAAYVTGHTLSSYFPTTTGAYDRSYNGEGDAFVVKLNPAGSGLLYATFLGGSGEDDYSYIAVDGSGAAYVTGYTSSSGFPTTSGAFDRSYNGGGDAFVVKLGPNGSGLLYATFLGGSDPDYGKGIVVDGSGAAYVTGQTLSSDFPTTPGAFDRSFNGECDAFVVKLNPTGSGLLYATFLGGSNPDYGKGIVVDGSGAVYVTGRTLSSDFPTTTGAYDRSYNGGGDAFAVKLNPTGSGLLYATFLGGGDPDYGEDIVVDGSGAEYVTGYTFSSDFPTTPGAFDINLDGYYDAFVVKLAMGDVPPPPPPTNVQASDGTYTNKVLVTWNPSSGATSYNVIRATSTTGTKSLLGSPTGTSFNDTTATPGVTYYYWVRACNGANCSGYSDKNTGWRKLSKPTNVQASDGTYTDKVLVTWNPSSGATSYKVYRAASATGTKNLLGSPTGTSFNDITATPGIIYYYWVKACIGAKCSGFSANDTGWRSP